MKKRWPSMILGLAVSVIALAYLFRRDLSGVQDELLGARYWTVIPCIAVSVIGLWLRSLRWRVLLDRRISRRDSFHILNVSYLINGVLPLRVGELVRAVLAARLDPPVQVLTSLSTILVERLLDTLAVFALVGLSLAILHAGLEIGILGMALGIGSVVGVIVLAVFAARPAWAHALLDRGGRIVPPLRRPWLHRWLEHLLDGIRPLASARATLLAVWWTAVGWTVSVVTGYILLYAIFDRPTWVASITMIALASFVIAVPAVPGNLGPFEAAVVFGLASAHLVPSATAAPAVAFALLLHVVNLVTYISMGLIGLWVEEVSLGEVTRAAQGLRRKRPASGAELTT
ncbi:MAG TPA: lysylphosphatidylglycerol synthase transmembrane domain-containing protein [Aggregatilineaceae bacterium]|nr:lysylphosphatidylglycerol synthase transmembrane domain-containing protein [Aggregatilineaceae bacterium]